VVGAGDESQVLEAGNLFKNPLRVIRMEPHGFPLRRRQLSRLVENIVGDAELSDVVQQRGTVQNRHVLARKIEAFSNRLRCARDSLGVMLHVG